MAHMPERSEYNEHPRRGASSGDVHHRYGFCGLGIRPAQLSRTCVLVLPRLVSQNGDFMLFGGHLTVGVGLAGLPCANRSQSGVPHFRVPDSAGHKGRTLGGMYTHMTIETAAQGNRARRVHILHADYGRNGGYVHYRIRTQRAYHALHLLRLRYPVPLRVAFAHRMPWDFVPGSSVAPALSVPVYGAADAAAAPLSHLPRMYIGLKEGAATVAGDDAVLARLIQMLRRRVR